MARKPRIEYEGAFYHVITRGNQRQKIFEDEKDYIKYLEILSRYKSLYKYRLYAYVLMNNHVHLLLETKDIPLSKIQQGINQSYTIYFNKKYNTLGHLFQGRYKAILCDKESYLLSLIKYIHLNPVRAKAVKAPEEYKWSSHINYIGREKGGIVDIDQVLRMFSEDKAKAIRLYRAYINDGIKVKKEDIYRTVDQRILGDESFVEQVTEKAEWDIEPKKRKQEHSLEEITRAIGSTFGITLKQMREKGKDREVSLCRKLLSITAKSYEYKGREIAIYLRKDPSVITRYLKESDKLRKETERVFKALKVINVNRQA
ncbi:MAG: transposase [Nitrospirae bacterium]|nr:transposase [Nitrospirota bacterium]